MTWLSPRTPQVTAPFRHHERRLLLPLLPAFIALLVSSPHGSLSTFDHLLSSKDHHEVFFCSEPHRRFHDGGGSSCFPFRIVRSPEIGRYVIASRKILRGETIFEELPGVVGPNPVLQTPICIACYEQVEPRSVCSTCRFPLCKESSCGGEHDGSICNTLARLELNLTPEEICSSSILHTIITTKLLLTRESDTSLHNCLSLLMDHGEDRGQDPEYLMGIKSPILGPLMKAFPGEEERVLKALGIVEVNSYEIFNPSGHAGFRGLFCLTSLLSHDCVPNARPIMAHKPPYGCIMMATRDISAGEAISINYVHPQKPNRIRKKTLKENWYFECGCRRCKDDSEFNLHPDAIKCCPQGGKMSPTTNNTYSCDKCGREKSNKSVQDLMDSLEKHKSELSRHDVAGYLKLYRKCSRTLSENHYFLNTLRRWIIPLYCRPLRSSPDLVPSQEMLREKVQLCGDYLRSLDLIEPGLSKNRGKVLYEWADSFLKLSGGREDLVSVRSALQEAVACLGKEIQPSFEYSLCQAASSTLKLVNEILN